MRAASLSWSSLAAAALVGVTVVTLGSERQAPSPPPPTDAIWRHRNLGKAFYENPTTRQQAVVEFKAALDLQPDSARERVNYGLALLRAGRNDEGVATLQQAQKQDPAIPHTWFNLGIAHKKASDHAAAIAQFEQMVRLVPDDAVSHYNLGFLYRVTDRPTEAVGEFERSAALDPNLSGPRFQLYNAYRDAGRPAEAAREQAVFQEIRKRQAGAAVPEDLEWSFYAEILDPADPAGLDPTAAASPVNVLDQALADPLGSGPGLLATDVDADGRADLVAWSTDGVRVYLRGDTLLPAAGLDGLRGVRAVAAGGFDNDGLPDLCVVGDAGAVLYANRKNRFERVPAPVPAAAFTAAVWVDYDHDYDLDLLLFGATSHLVRNNGQAGFAAMADAFPFVAGAALTTRAFDLVPDTMGRDVFVTFADREAVVYRDRLAGKFDVLPVPEAPAGSRVFAAGDLDGDATTDLLIGVGTRVVALLNGASGFTARPLADEGGEAAVPVDLSNRGLLDVVTGRGVAPSEGSGRFGPASPSPLGAAVAVAAADFDADGRVDVATVRPDGAVHRLRNTGAAGNGWVGVGLLGVRNMKLAAQAIVEVKAGRYYQKRTYDGHPLVFGLRDASAIDTVRITWPNGLVQNELRPRVGQVTSFKEAQRLSGSCPMIFTWNGHSFQFITDVLGVAPLGASSGDGTYFPVDHDEYIQIPATALVARDGAYEVRITEELREVSYLDRVTLMAVDHPRDVEVFTNDKFKSPPYPEFRLFGAPRRVHPISARGDDGRDLTPLVAARDRRYPEHFARSLTGVAAMHTLELDFGAAAPDNRAVLVLNGWVDWADGSTFLGAAQADPRGLVFPSLEVQDASGHWRTAVEDMGIPAGKPKTIAVDLTGKFAGPSRRVRIRTNLCIYWDEIFIIERSDAPNAVMTSIDAASADLRFRGFSTPEIHPERRQPEAFDYTRPTATPTWNPTLGVYTRYGDVQPLTTSVDDRFVIMGSGDELALRYPASALPTLPRGWVREFLLLVDGWAKDADPNTAFSQTVEPLPFHAMTAYPYGPAERFPDDAAHREYRERYNTRPALRLLRPLSGPMTARIPR